MAGMMDWASTMGWWGGMASFGIAAAIVVLINLIAIIWALADVMRTKKMDAGMRIGWVVIILALQIIGVIIYLFMRKTTDE